MTKILFVCHGNDLLEKLFIGITHRAREMFQRKKENLLPYMLSAERTKTATGSSGGFQRITGSSRFGGTALLRDRPALLLSCQGPAAVGKYTM